MGKLLALDLSTTVTGYALFEVESKELIIKGHFKPRNFKRITGESKKGAKGLKPRSVGYPLVQLKKMQDLSQQIRDLIDSLPDLECIVIEEINRGVARLSQKTLDGFHFILVDRLEDKLDMVRFRDSDGRDGWRTALKLFLTESDQKLNAQRRKVNAKISKGQKKLTITNRKHLACRWANSQFGLSLDCDIRESDGDEADALGLGYVTLWGI